MGGLSIPGNITNRFAKSATIWNNNSTGPIQVQSLAEDRPSCTPQS
jgi:hypothetical protein